MINSKLTRDRQSGAALIIALIFLLLMTVLSTSSMRTSTMQERMAGNMRDWNLGFQAAEAALRAAEEYLLETDVLPEFNGSGGLYELNADGIPSWDSPTPDAGSGSVEVDMTGVADVPRYYIEKLSAIRPAGTSTDTGTEVGEISYFRVTAVGYGAAADVDGNPLTSVVLRSVYRSR